MDGDLTLLAHLVPRLTCQVEDAATEALAFILNKSEACRRALGCFLQGEGLEPEAITRVATQIALADGSRPDVVGFRPRSRCRTIYHGGVAMARAFYSTA